MTRRWLVALAGIAALAAAAAAGVFVLDPPRAALPATGASIVPASAEQVARGAYLARAGHCAGCHTARGGEDFAGGRAIATPFGSVFAPNLTPDAATGLGRWSRAAFRRALHEGRSADGRRLAPVCPYPNFSLLGRAEDDDLFAYLRSLPAVVQPNRPSTLRFPYGTQAALAVWRALFFRPALAPHDATRSAVWNRGAALVGGLGHCSACHGRRNTWQATGGAWDLRGGVIPMQGWYAPALDDPRQAGLADWPLADVVALLKTGRSARASVSGPMAMVVARSLQYLNDDDLLAIATYLKALPQRTSAAPGITAPAASLLERGRKVYARDCADCHGDDGQGAPGAVPALAGNRAVVMPVADNVLHLILGGGFAPATAGDPEPYGMPPFATTLGDEDIAAVASYIRNAWGQQASAVTAFDVNRQRGGALP